MQNQILLILPFKYLILLPAVAAGLFTVTVSAFAFGLSDDDYVYLATTQHAERDHETANDPTARDKNVKDALAEFLDHQLWEKSHPGQLWDSPKR
jgi:hypothetical protein